MKLKVGLLLPHWGKSPPQPSPSDSSSTLSLIFLAFSGLRLTGWVGWALWCSGEWVVRCIDSWNEKVRKRKAIPPNGAKMDQEFMQKAGNLWLPRHALDLRRTMTTGFGVTPPPSFQTFLSLDCNLAFCVAASSPFLLQLCRCRFHQTPLSCMEDESCMHIH